MMERLAAFGRRARAALAPVAVAVLAVFAWLYRRRGQQLQTARVELQREKASAANEKLQGEISALEEKVKATDEERLTNAVLLRHMLDDGRDPGPRE